MAWIIMSVIIGFIVGVCEYGSSEGLLTSLLGFVVGVVLMFFVGGFLGCILPKEQTCREYELVALQDNIGVEGRKYLFSGYIEDKLKIRYIINTEKGKHIQTIDNISNIYINDNSEVPLLKIYNYKFKHNWSNWIAIIFENPEYVFYVPEGTIVTNYEIDLI